jgi:hypothetical protein
MLNSITEFIKTYGEPAERSYFEPYPQFGLKPQGEFSIIDERYNYADSGAYAIQILEDIAAKGFDAVRSKKIDREDQAFKGQDIARVGAEFRGRQAAKMILLGAEEISGIENYDEFKDKVLSKKVAEVGEKAVAAAPRKTNLSGKIFDIIVENSHIFHPVEQGKTAEPIINFGILEKSYQLILDSDSLLLNGKKLEGTELTTELKYLKAINKGGIFPPPTTAAASYNLQDTYITPTEMSLKRIPQNDTRFRNANFSRVVFDESERYPETPGIFNDADLENTTFDNCTFTNVDFSKIDSKIFRTIKFPNCKFENPTLPSGFALNEGGNRITKKIIKPPSAPKKALSVILRRQEYLMTLT